ncbi:MAG: hypothetical protein ACOYYS_12865 [Chloroflexota bacterium]
MSFDKKSFTDIYEAMVADTRRRIPQLSDFEEGSVVRSLFETFAVELSTLYEQLDLVYQAGFIDTAEGANLDRVVAVLGIKRNEPDFATGAVTFERDRGLNEELVIPIGTLVMTEEDESKEPPKKAYITIEEGRMPPGETLADVRIQAEERGKRMVADPETIVVMPRPVPGIKAVHNPKAVRFLGRDRENDEDLRQRAKQALLASGRASIASIENALIGMPGVREVRVKENFPADGKIDSSVPGLGMIEVYVDGLTNQNALALRQRIDQVRAAGVYVVLKPAIAIHLEAVIEIELDQRISAEEERRQAEKDVALAVEGLVGGLGMGESLLFSQLAGEILKVNGVKDVPNFQMTTYREDDSDASRAAGKITLTREATARAVTVPANTALCTELGQEFLTVADTVLGEGQPAVDVEVRATRSGRAGELVRTGSAIGWQKTKIGGMNFTAGNQFPIRIPRSAYGPIERRIDTQILERLVAESIRVAAGQKPLRVRVQVWLPALAEEMDRLRQVTAEVDAALKEIAQQHSIIEAAQKLIADTQKSFEASEQQRQAAEANIQILQAARKRLADADVVQQVSLDENIARQRQALDTLESAIEAARAEIEQQRRVIAGAEKAIEAAGGRMAQQRQTIAETEKAMQVTIEAAQKQRLAIEAAIQAFFASCEAGKSFTKSELAERIRPAAGENSDLRLVSFPFQSQAPEDDYLVEASFIEKPEAEIVFVYCHKRFLNGRLQLVLPLTASDAEKSDTVGAARQTIKDFLDALAPEEDIDLEKLQEAVAAVEKVLRLEFRPEDCTLLDAGDALLDGRVKDRAVRIDAFEKVFLSEKFEIEA